MTTNPLDEILAALLAGKKSRAEALHELQAMQEASAISAAQATCNLGDVQLDLDRRRRCGYSEVIYGEGKSLASLQRALSRLMAEGEEALATRISPLMAEELRNHFPHLRYNEQARTVRMLPSPHLERPRSGRVAVVTAGTTDLPVAEEARETLDWMGVTTDLILDVGVAGPQRLPAQLHRIIGNDAVVVVAGMEAALPSVVAGHVNCPVIGVPTSVGYGANLGGVAALLSMINSCAANVVVVNIDAGFKGGYVAGMIAKQRHQPK
jgi:NCAIR mutase (PurE)-related protein